MVSGSVEEAGIKEGDKIKVKLMEIDPKTGKYKLSHRVLMEKPEGYVERERPSSSFLFLSSTTRKVIFR